MKKLISVVAVGLVCLSLAGCNTARGFGADLELLGRSMKNAGKKDETGNTATTSSTTSTTTTTDGVVTQPYQDPSYYPPATTETYPADQGTTTYPQYK
jgi:predicted small secreted protein